MTVPASDRYGQRIPRWRDVDPCAVRHAVAGLIPARKLTTDERRRAVEYLTQVERLTDREIALRLRWTGWEKPRPGAAVAQFRHRWEIPAGICPVEAGRRRWAA